MERTMPLIEHLAKKLCAMKNCEKSDNQEWLNKHYEAILWLVKNALPSGSGINNGTKIDFDKSEPEKIVLSCGFHHMNDVGFYDGWTEHKIAARPSFVHRIDLSIGGRDRNGIKEY